MRPTDTMHSPILLLLLFLLSAALGEAAVDVAIVGAGVGGAATAHFLREALGEDGVRIVVLEVAATPAVAPPAKR